MEVPERVKAFSKDELKEIIRIITEKGMIGEWEEPLINHYMEVKSWGPSCTRYLKKFGKVDYDIALCRNSTGTDRILYDPERFTKEEAIAYGDYL